MGSSIRTGMEWIFGIIYLIIMYSLFIEFAGITTEDQPSVEEIRERNYFIMGLLLVIPGFYLTINKNWKAKAGVLIGHNYRINRDTSLSIDERAVRYSQFERQVKKEFMIANIIPWVVVLLAIVFFVKSNIIISIILVFVTSIIIIHSSSNDILNVFRPEKNSRSTKGIDGNFYQNTEQSITKIRDRNEGGGGPPNL